MKIDWKKEISFPKLRRPSLPKPSRPSAPKVGRPSVPRLSRPSLGGPELHAPKFLADLYADLRDRRLLPLVALLLVAIVAAPVLLSSGSQEEPAAITPASVAGGETKDAGLTVVPAEPGLRDYQHRLGHRKALNPFRRAPEAKAAEGSSSSGGSGGGESESGSSAEPTSSGGNVTTTTVGGVTTETVGSSTSPGPVEQPRHHKSSQAETAGSESSESSPSEPTPSAPAESTESVTPAEPTHTESSPHGSTAGTASNPAEPAGQKTVVGYTIDAEAGFVPKTTEKTNIAPMTKLPNKKHPLVLFMGLSKDHKRALFLMTSNVTAYYGGHCALDKQACQLVEVKPGKGVTFAAGYGESRYKLHLQKIVPVFHFSK